MSDALCIRCRLVGRTDNGLRLFCRNCINDFDEAGYAVIVAAYTEHRYSGCGCDPKYVWTCRRFQEAILPGAHPEAREGRAAVNLQAELDRLEPRYMETLDEAERRGD